MIVTASNGRGLSLNQIKPEDHVTRELRYTIKEAIEMMPKTKDRPPVTDIVFMVGLNDFRRNKDAKNLQEKYLDMQMAYAKQFPKARQHVTAMPPLDDEYVEANKLLQKLSKHTGSNFVSTKSFLDRSSGKLRANLMRDPIHYNEWGVRILAKEIKKSLYSKANMENSSLSQFVANNQTESRPPVYEVDVSDMHGA